MRIGVFILAMTGILFSLTLSGAWGSEGLNPCQIPEAYVLTRPDPEKGPTQVQVSLFLVNITKVDDVNQTFTADFYLKTLWKDPRLARSSAEAPATCRFPLEKVWYPQIVITNEAELSPQYKHWVTVDAAGTVTHSQRYYGSLTNDFELRDFPFDRQVLTISLGSYLPDSEVVLEAGPFTGTNPEMTITNWVVKKPRVQVTKKFIKLDQQTHFRYLFQLPVERHIAYFLWTFFTPILMIVIMSWLVFWISAKYRVVQISLSSTSFLTLVAYQIRLAVNSPHVDYLTTMTQFSLWCIFIVLLSLIETIATSVLAGMGQEERAKRLDRLSRYLFPISFTFVCILIILF